MSPARFQHRGAVCALIHVPLLVALRAGPVLANDAPSPSVDASSAAYRPNIDFNFSVPKLAQAIRIDGRLDEPMWQPATKLTGFLEVEPGDNVRPKAETEAFLAYDNDNF